MHAIRPDRRVLLAALVAFVCALAAAAAAPSLSDIDLGGGTTAAPAATEPAATTDGAPAWATDPLAPPPLLREAR